jgi:hypothetical protein
MGEKSNAYEVLMGNPEIERDQLEDIRIGGRTPAFQCSGPGSVPGQVMWDF